MSQHGQPVPLEEDAFALRIDEPVGMDPVTLDVAYVSRETNVRDDIHQLECALWMLCEEVVSCCVSTPSCWEALVDLKLHSMNEIREVGAIIDEERRYMVTLRPSSSNEHQ